MLRRFIWLMPLAIGLFPASVNALPTSPQINQLTQQIVLLRQTQSRHRQSA